MKACSKWVCDFEHLDDAALPSADTAICCLGTTIKVAGSQLAFKHVDLELVSHFAKAAKRAGVTCLVMVSAAGASEASRFFYSRVKAMAEHAVEQLGFDSLVIARPSLLLGDRDALAQPGALGRIDGAAGGTSAGTDYPARLPSDYRPASGARAAGLRTGCTVRQPHH